VTLATPHDGDLGERLLQALAAKSYRVRALSRVQPTLEDVFLAATRRSWDIVDLPKAGARPPEAGRPR
jgi:ABC-2 type transport system ATP-binding protein